MISEVLFLFFYVNYSLAIDYSFEELLVNTSISQATTRIVHDFYVKESSAVVFTAGYINEPNRLRQSDLMNEILERNRKSDVKFRIQEFQHISSTYPEVYNVIFIDSYEGFSSILKKMTATNFDYTGLYAIILTESYRDQYNIITRVLEDCWSLYIVNVIVLATIEIKTRTAIYTYFPFTIYHCEVVAPVISNYFIHNSFLYEGADLFPPKLNNLYKCPLHVATSEQIPYMFLIPQKNGSIYTDGIDGILFRVLSQRLNFTPILLIPSPEEIVKETPEDGSSFSVWMKMVHSGRANLTISAFAYTKDRAELLTASFPYFFSSLLFAVPNGRQYSAFFKLFLILKYIIWSCIATSFGIGFFTIFVLKFSTKTKRTFLVGRNNHTPFLNMVNLFFGGSLVRPPTRNFARTVFYIRIVACTVIRSAYQGALFDLMKKPKNVPPLTTVSELIKHDYTLYVSASTLNMFKFAPEVREKISTHDFSLEEKFIKLREPKFKGAFVTTEALVAYLNMKHVTNNQMIVRITTDRVLLMPLCIYFRKHSCLTKTFDQQIKLYVDSGLMKNWVSHFSQKKYVRFQSTENQRAHQKLQFSQLKGIFQLCAITLCLPILIFFLELLSRRIFIIRKLIEILD